MKTFFVLLVVALVAFSCKKDDTKPSFVIDPDAKVRIECESTGLKSANSEHLTPLEVVKQATVLQGYNKRISDTPIRWTWVGKDTISEIPALLRWGTDIIYDSTGYGDYGLQHEFIDGYDFVICSGNYPNYDTIAYIPNSNFIDAKLAISEAIANLDTTTVYDTFKNAFSFIPITGVEWRLLKSQGLN